MSIFVFGNATLIFGDCHEWLPKIGPVDALVMDPPYLINTSGGGKMRKVRKSMDGIAANGLDKGFDHSIIKPELYKSVVTFCHNDQLHILLPFLAQNYRRHKVCFWRKTNTTPVANRAYRASLEPYIHAWNQGAHPMGELEDLEPIITTTVFRHKFDHPTVKPPAVMDKIIKNVNAETVLDPFMGTGSTGVAAIKAGKKFIGIENNPNFFNTAVLRIISAHSGG